MIDLKQFCSTDRYRVNLHNPFSRGAYTYATNGHIAVRVPRIMDWPEQEKPDPESLFEKYFTIVPMGQLQVALPEIKDLKRECRECRGSGKEHDCPDCTCECEACDGDGKIDDTLKVSVLVGNAVYEGKYIAQLLKLPGLKLPADPPKDEAAPFVFDGGEGIIMPMRAATVQL